MAAKRDRRRARKKPPPEQGIQGEKLEPIAVVERELTRPDGSKLRVQVPVYPPFRLPDPSAETPPRARKRDRAKKAS